ncbi:MAG: hypothetical protein BAJALOKI3v1_160034 [Promethearchaeota archaeon]|nr:MAG: hypothetical protein BAJALOKI3v1_160034 [Candidatus Lokiarchaeota archaeon]
MRARACIKCREYVLIRPDDPGNMTLISKFEKNHRGHTLITLNFEEIKGTYKKFLTEEEKKASEEKGEKEES